MGRFERPARHSGRLRLVPCGLLAGWLLSVAGCGGGGQADVQPPPPAPDFLLTLSPATVTVTQGNTSSTVSVSVTPLHGFSGQVQVSLATLPDGVEANPASPFTVSTGANVALLITAGNNASVGSVNLTATGTSGSLTHTAPLSLNVQSNNSALVSRSNYVRTNSMAILDSPPGEPHHRHMVLDVVHQHLFVANRARNLVEVISTQGASKVAEVSAPGASSADISSDGKSIWIGSTTQVIYELDPAILQIRAGHLVPPLAPLPGSVFERPEEVLAMSSGKLMVRLRQPATAESLLALWDPASNSIANLTSAAPQVFQNGLGVMAKSADGSRLFVTAADSSGEIALFDSNGALVAGPQTIGGGAIPFAAANKTATRFAVLFNSGAGPQVELFDSSLNPLGSYTPTNPSGLVFSQDGSTLFVSEQFGAGSVVSSLDSNTLHLLSRVSDNAIGSVASQLEESDSTKLLFGLANRGISFVDASVSATLLQNAPAFSVAPVALPSSGPNTGNTGTILTGSNFESNPIVQFGSQSAHVQNSSSTQMQVTSPANAANGSVNISAFFPDGWTTIAPDAFSYGPQILELLPSAGSKNGNEMISLYGYGFGSDPAKLTVKIGSTVSTVQKIDQVTSVAPSLGLDSTFPFPLQRVTLVTPAGTPGVADVVVSSPDGANTLIRGFEYLQSEQVFTKAGLYKFLTYDQKRQRLYLSNIDHVDVFDLTNSVFISPLQPPGGPPPNAGLRGLALMPDASKLVIADFGAQSIYLINPDTASGTTSFVGGIPGYVNSGPSRVAATSAQTVFVGMAAEGGAQNGCSSCLAQMDVTAFPPTVAPASQPEISFLTGSPLLQSSSAGDRVFFSFSTAPGGPIAVWDATAPGQFQTLTASASTIDLPVSADGNLFAVRENSQTLLRNSGLNLLSINAKSELENVPGRTEVPGAAMHPSGALLYVPFLTGSAPALPPAVGIIGGVDILDARTGALRRRLFLPEPFAMLSTDIDGQHGSFLAIDEYGQRIFALTTSGLTVVQLSNAPLGIGSLTPANGSISGGTSVTVRGSGFQSGVKASLGGKSVSITFKDTNTVSFVTPSLSSGAQQIVITNPNGETCTLDVAFIAN